ncbi:MAG: superoxide dismutase family protein [Oscillibacter sp.]|nr:superoxide dismutase family protein [Oscillibacter sp.]
MNRSSYCGPSRGSLLPVLRGRAQAAASITGSESCPDASGTVRFYQTKEGVIVLAEVSGLPQDSLPCHERVFGFHIHTGSDCGGNMDDPFADAMSHYDPDGCEHPFHAGDLPPLFGNGGLALSLFLTNRFSVEEIIGRTVIIHDHPDDFTTQPSGNSGTKIACGVIKKTTGRCP